MAIADILGGYARGKNGGNDNKKNELGTSRGIRKGIALQFRQFDNNLVFFAKVFPEVFRG
jgi:hypothetical protein